MADAPPADDRVFAGVELGGTKGIALVWRDGKIFERHRVPTTDPEQTLDALADWLAGHPLRDAFAGLGIASFGPVRLDPDAAGYGRILATTKPGWSDARSSTCWRETSPVPSPSIPTSTPRRWPNIFGVRDGNVRALSI